MLLARYKSLDRPIDISPYMGCDPEFFFKQDGAVIGAEKLIPKEGWVYNEVSKFTIDGVQAELNPRPNYCRANLANEIRACMVLLKKKMEEKGKGFTCDFSRTVEISKENLMELDEQSRKFGCAPSKSICNQVAGILINDVNPEEYRIRAAGGHIHIGRGDSGPQLPLAGLFRACTTDLAKTVELLDLICGNTCVLVDRDEGNKERRKVYGKAGEYRTPKHGLEYRTLSNFWLTSYPLMSFAFGMARLAVQLIADVKNHEIFYKAFTSRVKQENVQAAINFNDFDLAMENFRAIEPLLMEVSSNSDRYAITSGNIKEFYHFVKMIQDNGMKYWFKQDPLTHWTTINECHRGGFYDYLTVDVREDMKKSAVKEAKAA